jgi:integrase
MTNRKPTDATGKVPDRSSQTTALYRQRGWRYVAQTRRELRDPNASLSTVVDVFLNSDHRYKLTSQRAIKAWLLQVIADALVTDSNNSALVDLPQKLHAGCGPSLVGQLQRKLGNRDARIEHVVAAFLSADRQYTRRSQKVMIRCLRGMIESQAASGELSKTDGEELIALMERNTPRPKACRRTKNTSTKKRKEVPFDELLSVTQYLSKTGDELNIAASTYLKSNIFLGLRPGEWKSAYLEGNTFHWTAEKTTNNRGNVKNPHLQLQSQELWIGTLRWLLDFFKPYRDDEKQWSRLFDRLRSRIAYACKKLGIARISFYTTRDIFIATELLLGTDPIEVAAKVNHKSARTHRRHYATKFSGYKMSRSLTAVDQRLVATVVPIELFSLEKLKDPELQLPL